MFIANYKFSSITDITIDFLVKNKIEILLLNLAHPGGESKNIFERKDVVNWINNLNYYGIFLIVIAKNKNKEEMLNYQKTSSFAIWESDRKPLKSDFNSLLYNTGYYNYRKNVAIVGNNFFDILNGSRSNLISILVK